MSLLIKILFILLAIIALLFVLLVLGSFLGSAILTGWVIKKSIEKKTPEFLTAEKSEMQMNVQQMRAALDAGAAADLQDISNDLNYSYNRWITSILKGYMLNAEGKKILAFERRQRGNDVDCRIMAVTSSTSYFFEMNPVETIVEINGKRRGSFLRSGDITDTAHNIIGSMLRIGTPEVYTIQFKSGASANINGSKDNKPFINNIWFERVNHPIPIRRKIKVYRPPYTPYAMVSSSTALSADEKDWVLAAAILEALVNSFSFTS